MNCVHTSQVPLPGGDGAPRRILLSWPLPSHRAQGRTIPCEETYHSDNMGRQGGLSGVAYVVHRELYIRPPTKIWQVQYPTSRLTQFFHYPKNQKYIYSSDSYPQEWISQSFSLTCPTKVNFPENGSVGRPNGLENTPRGCTIHSEEVWARGEPWRPIS